MYCYLCGRSCELWNNRSVSLCSCLTPTGKDRRETLWCEGSYIWRKSRYNYLSEQTIRQITIGEQGWHSGGSVRETPPTSMPMPYVGWICCQVSSLLREVSLRVTRVFPYPKNVAIPDYISTRDQVDHEKILKKEIKTILMGFFWSEVKRLGSRLFLVHLDWVEWINS